MQICSVDNCYNKKIARGLCHKHYKRWQVHKNTKTNLKPRNRKCKELGCDKKHAVNGHCQMHAMRLKRYGRLNNVLKKFNTFLEAYNHDVIKKDGCWDWNGSKHQFGYGQVSAEGKVKFIHRLSWEMHFGKIPPNLFVCHRCDNPICSNPQHLFLGTQKDNIQDCINKKRFKRAPDITKPKGEKSNFHKLKENEIKEILQLLKQNVLLKEIAAKYNVTIGTISCIKLNKTWKHIPRN